ncbi:class I SAM-dependent methyltransferase [Maricaulis sp. D1M11]|uniref:class I SAM-dependent methyltransferase n=1 Tax=Maricaulis sp. D1M11 TaxID=3076117 RepID=UPI0039B3EECE
MDGRLDRPSHVVPALTRLQSAPLVPEIDLYLADDRNPLWRLSEEALAARGLPAPFWAFAWSGSQAIARHVLDHPDLVRGRNILDFAAGCGLAGLAAARAGAASVTLSEIDPFAIEACRLNARHHRVEPGLKLADLTDSEAEWDVILAGDVFYTPDGVNPITNWLSGLAHQGCTVLIGDPGRAYLPRLRLKPVAHYQAEPRSWLEDMEIRNARLWSFDI